MSEKRMVEVPDGWVLVPRELPDAVQRESNLRYCVRQGASVRVFWERALGHVAKDPAKP